MNFLVGLLIGFSVGFIIGGVYVKWRVYYDDDYDGTDYRGG